MLKFRKKRVDDALAAVNMTEYAEHGHIYYPGGQKQRKLPFFGVLAMKPDCIVLDEPTVCWIQRAFRGS